MNKLDARIDEAIGPQGWMTQMAKRSVAAAGVEKMVATNALIQPNSPSLIGLYIDLFPFSGRMGAMCFVWIDWLERFDTLEELAAEFQRRVDAGIKSVLELVGRSNAEL